MKGQGHLQSELELLCNSQLIGKVVFVLIGGLIWVLMLIESINGLNIINFRQIFETFLYGEMGCL